MLVVRAPTTQEFIALRRAAEWHVPDPDAAAIAIEDSLFTVGVEKDRHCFGAGRVVGDGSLVFLVQKKADQTFILDRN
jgi:hypothetical protein